MLRLVRTRRIGGTEKHPRAPLRHLQHPRQHPRIAKGRGLFSAEVKGADNLAHVRLLPTHSIGQSQLMIKWLLPSSRFRVAGDSTGIRRMEISPPVVLDECIGDFASSENFEAA